MSAYEFWDFQDALIYVFGPFIYWLAAFLIAGGILVAICYCFMNLFAWMSRRRS